jgi:uncharacterized protein
MNRRTTLRVCIAAVQVLLTQGALTSPRGEGTLQAPPAVSVFDLGDVHLLEGPFRHAMELEGAYILVLKPDRLLSRCREYAGLVPRDSTYGGWEKEALSSHFVGHYLSACALQYRGSGDRRFLDRITYVVDQLAECQKANGNGYVTGIPDGKRVFAEVKAGKIRAKGFDLNGVWSPWYTVHKIMAGLRDAWLLAGNAKAREVLLGMSDWTFETTKGLSDSLFQSMLDCEFGGMNEVLADVYTITGERKYLDLAEKFCHRAVMDPLAREEDRLEGLHGNTNIPKLIGAARLYEITGEPRFAVMSRFFWETVTRNHSYAAGGHGEYEHFGAPRRLSDRLSEGTMETCNTYNMLKLTRFLFTRKPDGEYADFYERALYNHILASQNPDDGMVCYFVPMGSGTHKLFSTPFDDFTCCLGTGLENHSRYGECIYFHARDTLYVNLFIASEVNWRDRGIRITQRTDFPNSGSTRLIFSCAKPSDASVKIRHPFWAGPLRIALNGQSVMTDSAVAGFAVIRREWKTGDTLDVTLPMSIRLEPLPDMNARAAVMYGPLLLAGDLGPVAGTRPVPLFVTNGRSVETWTRQVTGRPLTFETRGVGRPGDVTLTPFYMMHDRRYAVYWDCVTDREWGDRLKEEKSEQARLRSLESRTVDSLVVGETGAEHAHRLEGEMTTIGHYRGRAWRQAAGSGWFSFELNSRPDARLQLVVTYWGSETEKREFDIIVDGRTVATQLLSRNSPGKFFDATYALPADLTRGKGSITVRFSPLRGAVAGRLFGARLVTY